MKKLILLFVLATTMSCSNEEETISNNVSESNSSTVLDGKMLSYPDKDIFVKEYSELSNLKSEKDIQDWISKKGLESLLNTSNDSIEMENDVLSDTRIIYSDALKAILNSESKLKIEEKTVWLNERNFYVLSENEIDKSSEELILIKDKLEVYGSLLSISNSKTDTKSSLTGRNVIPNENRSKTYVVGLPNDKRYVLDLFNETIVINNEIYSSKMYLRYTLQYKSCSFWRCTWKNDTTTQWGFHGDNLTNSGYPWSLNPLPSGFYSGQNTFLLATWYFQVPAPVLYSNFDVSGSINWRYANSTTTYPQAISWY